MAAHSEHAHNAKSAEKPAGHPKKGIAGEEGEIAGIRKPKHRLRRLKFAAKKAAITAVAIAAGAAATLMPTPASAGGMPRFKGIKDASSSMAEKGEEEEYLITRPKEFAKFPAGQSAEERLETLSKKASFPFSFAELNEYTFSIKTSGGEIVFGVSNPEVFVYPKGKELAFSLNISQYHMRHPVPRLEETNGKAILHIIDVQTGTDLTLTFPLYAPPSADHVKARAFEDAGVARSNKISRDLLDIVKFTGAKLSEANLPQTSEEEHDLYSLLGAEMVNKLSDLCSAAPPGYAAELARRGQAMIAATMLGLYLPDEDERAELAELRMDPNLDKKKLESFADEKRIRDEFEQIWPQCSASYEA